jgi:LAS superfamily LD-carboxypeptidase LdcB
MLDIDFAQLTGQTQQHLNCECLPLPVHRAVVAPLLALQRDAAAAGFELAIASSFRSYERQSLIWNGKASGQRPVYDQHEQLLDMNKLDDWQKAQAILRWSALPGASRHHWGTDLDIYDCSAVPEGYQLQLSQAEVSEGGPFYRFHCWLDEQIAAGRAHGFFRPYNEDRGGVAPEPWHISYAPVARLYQQQLKLSDLRALWQSLALAESILAHAEMIYQTYIEIPWDVYPEII